ncbi:hypothetical protein [Streptomyces thermolilacinus]|uniref:hypothetical protein n=1 Tax=Streptomyces thermolilacinus TaxID=285540 RepID=UPI00340EF774
MSGARPRGRREGRLAQAAAALAGHFLPVAAGPAVHISAEVRDLAPAYRTA